MYTNQIEFVLAVELNLFCWTWSGGGGAWRRLAGAWVWLPVHVARLLFFVFLENPLVRLVLSTETKCPLPFSPGSFTRDRGGGGFVSHH
jgi:hypothetical protein